MRRAVNTNQHSLYDPPFLGLALATWGPVSSTSYLVQVSFLYDLLLENSLLWDSFS
jgi:hypothetical protein